MDVAFHRFDDQGVFRQTLFVTPMSPGGFGWRDGQTLAPVQNKELVPALVPVSVEVTIPPSTSTSIATIRRRRSPARNVSPGWQRLRVE